MGERAVTQRAVSQLKPGVRLAEEVYTPLGSLLFHKGTLIGTRELEILRAFLVERVKVEDDDVSVTVRHQRDPHLDPRHHDEARHADKQREKARREKASFPATDSLAPFYHQYQKLFRLIKKAFPNAVADNAQSLPLLEIRQQLKQLLDQIELYDVLSFRPPYPDVKDYFYHNSILVALTSYLLAQWHGLPAKEHFPIALAGLLHNIGTLKVDPDLLSKKSELTSREIAEIRRHPVFGFQLLKDIPGLNEGIKMAALQHHEKIDGSGYPLGIKGEQIHIYAKIVSVADIYHAMTSDRHYKKAESPYIVLEQLFHESFGKLDPSLVQTFINRITSFQHGVIVRLSNNAVGEIVFTDRNNPTRPWVKVNGNIINLVTDRSLHIVEVLRT